MADTPSRMDDFGFGDPPRRAARPAEPKPRRARARLDGRLVWVVAAVLVVAGAVAFVVLNGSDEAEAPPRTTSPVDRALDAAAQSTIGRAVVVAQTLHGELGSFPADGVTLSAEDPTLTFTADPSSGPTSVSFAAEDDAFAAAVRSESGTCWWVRVDPSGATSYGSGSSCTGEAAMGASDDTW